MMELYQREAKCHGVVLCMFNATLSCQTQENNENLIVYRHKASELALQFMWK